MVLIDRILIGLAAAYLSVVAAGVGGSGLHASADRVIDGEVWLLLTNGLEVVPGLDVAQWLLLAASMIAVIWRHGPKLWWATVLVGQVGAALIAYAFIGLLAELGSGAAEHAATQPDYGISVVLAATLGGLAAGGLVVPAKDRDRADKAAISLGLIGVVGAIAFSVGWYDIQHLIGYAIGFVIAGWLLERDLLVWARPGSGKLATAPDG